MQPLLAAALMQTGAGLCLMFGKSHLNRPVSRQKLPFMALSIVVGAVLLPLLTFYISDTSALTDIFPFFIWLPFFAALFIFAVNDIKQPLWLWPVLLILPLCVTAFFGQTHYMALAIVILLSFDIVLIAKFLENNAYMIVMLKNLLSGGILLIAAFLSGTPFPTVQHIADGLLLGLIALSLFYVCLIKTLSKTNTVGVTALLTAISAIGLAVAPLLAAKSPAVWFITACAACTAILSLVSVKKAK